MHLLPTPIPIIFFLTLLTLPVLPVTSSSHHPSPKPVPSFAYTRPFPYDNTAPLNAETKCEVLRSFHAKQYTQSALQSSPYATIFNTFLSWHPSPYPGSWEGMDFPNPNDREYLVMEYADVPTAVRDWVDGQKRDGDRWWGFGNFERPGRNGTSGGGKGEEEEKVMIFAPGSLYEILPLWVGEGSECEGEFCLFPTGRWDEADVETDRTW